MILLGDLEKLQERSEAEHLLKPWFDIVIDVLVVVLVLIAVVTGVVALYAPGPICIPQSLSQTTQNKSIPEFTNRNLFDFINSKCLKDIDEMVLYYPNGLILLAGTCLICSNVWFRLKSAVLKRYHDLLKNSNVYTACPREEGEVKRLKSTWDRFESKVNEYDATKCWRCWQNQCCVLCRRDPCSLKRSYILSSIISLVNLGLWIILLGFAICRTKAKAVFSCTISESLPYKNFHCSYSIAIFYFFSAVLSLVMILLHTGFSVFKVAWAATACCKKNAPPPTEAQPEEAQPEQPIAQEPQPNSAAAKDFAFLRKLVKTTNPSQTEKYWDVHNQQHQNPTGLLCTVNTSGITYSE